MDMNPYNKLVGRNLRWIRTHSGLTQDEIGQMLNITFQQVQKYEQGTNRMSAGMVLALSTTLNVPIEWFFKEGLFFTRNENTPEIEMNKEDRQTIRLMKYYNKITSEEMRHLVLMVARRCSKSLAPKAIDC